MSNPTTNQRNPMDHGVGAVHHIELWVPDFARAAASWEWLLGTMGYERHQAFTNGGSWRHPASTTYIVLEQSPAMLAIPHDRHRPGLNHLAFHAGSREFIEQVTTEAQAHGWALRERITPHDDGAGYYATYLTDRDGFEVELVAEDLAQ